MEEVKLSIDHKHPLLPVTRFSRDHKCLECGFSGGYIYGGYRCNELGCGVMFHRECAESLSEIRHSSHPEHPLKPFKSDDKSDCSRCGELFTDGFICSICDFKLDESCAKLSEHRFMPDRIWLTFSGTIRVCTRCDFPISGNDPGSKLTKLCGLPFHPKCGEYFLEANHTCHPQHPLKFLRVKVAPGYADEICLLCKREFNKDGVFHHCDVCNFSICLGCMKFPPPVRVESPTTHEHELYLVPRRIDFTCNACGKLGDRSPYFCLQCNFMIHRECIDLPRVIKINRHDHRISYTPRLGHGEDWKCRVCREKVDGFYGAYTCAKCPTLAVHSLCATRNDVWDMVELEGTPDEEEEEIPPFEVIDANTIRHFSHTHILRINNKDGHGQIQPETIVCEACRLQILSEPFYSCDQCNFVLHEKCANHPRKRRHPIHNLPFTLIIDRHHEVDKCAICDRKFTGFRYISGLEKTIDVRCGAISDTLEHGSHHDTLYFDSTTEGKHCSRCGVRSLYACDKCDYALCRGCVSLPEKVIRNRYDDHPLLLSFGEKDVDRDYWCEACERKVKPKVWFYTCYDCGTVLHISCVVGKCSYIMPGIYQPYEKDKVLSNTSISRPLCCWCKSRCKLPYMLKLSHDDVYACSYACSNGFRRNKRRWQS